MTDHSISFIWCPARALSAQGLPLNSKHHKLLGEDSIAESQEWTNNRSSKVIISAGNPRRWKWTCFLSSTQYRVNQAEHVTQAITSPLLNVKKNKNQLLLSKLKNHAGDIGILLSGCPQGIPWPWRNKQCGQWGEHPHGYAHLATHHNPAFPSEAGNPSQRQQQQEDESWRENVEIRSVGLTRPAFWLERLNQRETNEFNIIYIYIYVHVYAYENQKVQTNVLHIYFYVSVLAGDQSTDKGLVSLGKLRPENLPGDLGTAIHRGCSTW